MFGPGFRIETVQSKTPLRQLAAVCLGTACLTAIAGFSALKIMEPSERELRLKAIANQAYTMDPAHNDLKDRAIYALSEKRTPTEEKLTAVFQKVGNTAIQVQCAPIPDWMQKESDNRIQAYIDRETGLARVAPEHCDGAAMVIDKKEPFTNDTELDKAALGVQTLTHENEHLLHPDDSESEVDCYAIQETAKAVKQLGGSDAVASQIGKRTAIIRPQRQPKEYISPETCYDGGAHDLDPQSTGYFPRVNPAEATK